MMIFFDNIIDGAVEPTETSFLAQSGIRKHLNALDSGANSE